MLPMSTSFSLSPSLALLATVSRTPSRVTRCPTMPHYQPVSLRRLAKLRSKAAEATGQLTLEHFCVGRDSSDGARLTEGAATCSTFINCFNYVEMLRVSELQLKSLETLHETFWSWNLAQHYDRHVGATDGLSRGQVLQHLRLAEGRVRVVLLQGAGLLQSSVAGSVKVMPIWLAPTELYPNHQRVASWSPAPLSRSLHDPWTPGQLLVRFWSSHGCWWRVQNGRVKLLLFIQLFLSLWWTFLFLDVKPFSDWWEFHQVFVNPENVPNYPEAGSPLESKAERFSGESFWVEPSVNSSDRFWSDAAAGRPSIFSGLCFGLCWRIKLVVILPLNCKLIPLCQDRCFPSGC